jgi:hypothetical protein
VTRGNLSARRGRGSDARPWRFIHRIVELVLPHGARVTYRAVDRNGNASAAYLVVAR